MANTNPKIVEETLEAKIARLTAENEALRATKAQGRVIRCKIGEKGGISLYGFGKFPYTGYRETWEAIFANQKLVMDFAEKAASLLKTKAESKEDYAKRVTQAMRDSFNSK